MIQAPQELNRKLCEMFGVDPARTIELDLKLRVDCLPELTVKRYLPSFEVEQLNYRIEKVQLVPVDITDFASKDREYTAGIRHPDGTIETIEVTKP